MDGVLDRRYASPGSCCRAPILSLLCTWGEAYNFSPPEMPARGRITWLPWAMGDDDVCFTMIYNTHSDFDSDDDVVDDTRLW